MHKYLLTNRKSGNSLEAEFDQRGLLCAFRIEGEPPAEGIAAMLRNFPLQESEVQNFRPDIFKVECIPVDVKFADFWDAYGQKVGKQNAEKEWSKLSIADRARAIRVLPRYRLFLQSFSPPRRAKDPERYLSQRVFNDELNF